MIRNERWKYLEYKHSEKRQLFDLQNDLHELCDLLMPWRGETNAPWFFPDAARGREVRQIAETLQLQLEDWRAGQN